MAEVSNNDEANATYSCFLFTKPDGSQMTFRLHPCQEKTQLRSLIEAGGGCMTNIDTGTSDAISLILPTKTAKSDNMVSSTYIHDCIEANKLLNVADYRVTKGHSFDSPPCSLNMRSKGFTGRSTYFPSEDKAMIDFLLTNNAVGDIGGNRVWKQMESYKVIKRTWQSAKDRFRKHILPNIRSYSLTHEDIEKFQKKESRKDNRSPRTSSVEHSSSTEEDNAINDDDDNSETYDEPDKFDADLIRMASCNGRAVEEPDGTDQCMTADLALPKGTDGCRQAINSSRSVHSGRTNEGLSSGFAKTDLKTAKVCRVEDVSTNASTQSSSGRVYKENQASVENIARTNAENKSRGRNVEQSVLNRDVSKRCQAEVALADSQSSKESNSPQKRKSAGKLIPSTSKDSSVRMEPTGKLNHNVCRTRLGSSTKKDKQKMTTYGKQKKIQPSATCSRDSVESEVEDTPAATQTDISNYGAKLRRFVVNSSSTEMNNSEPNGFVNAEVENKLTTCDNLLSWLNISPVMFAHAVFQSNGSVDSAVKLLLGNSARLWDTNDDANLFSGNESVMRNLEQKYGKQPVAERIKFLEENPMFL